MNQPAQRDLAQTLRFSDEELAANRVGRLAGLQSAQMARIWASRSFGRRASLLAGLAAVMLVVVIRVILVGHIFSQAGARSWPQISAAVGAALLLIAVMGLSVLRARSSLDRLVAGCVSMTEGVAATRVRRPSGRLGRLPGGRASSHGDRYELTIGGVRFFVGSRAVLTAFTDGQVYRGYYIGAGAAATLLSAERVTRPEGIP